MNKNYFIFLKRYVLNQKKLFLIVCLVTLCNSAVIMCIPMVYQNLIDKAIPNRNFSFFGVLIFVMISCYILSLVFNVAKDYILGKIAENLCRDLRTQLHQKISVVKYSYFDQHSLSDVLSKYNKEVETIKNNCGYMLIKVFSNILTFVSAGTIVAMMEWRLLFVSSIIILLYVINNKYWSKRVKVLSAKSMKCNEEAIDTMNESYNNAIITKIYSAYDFVNSKFNRVYEYQKNTQIELELTYSLNVNSGGFLVYLLFGIVWIIGGLGIFAGTMTVGTVTALTNYNNMLLGPVNFFSAFSNSYQSTIIAIERLMEIFDYEEETSKNEDYKIENINEIYFDGVSFEYDKANTVLENVSLKLKKGNIVAFLGGSGCGKSTFVKMLLRLYNPVNGEIYFDGKRIEEINLQSLRSKIAFVPQDSCFYRGSIIENLSMGKEIDEVKILHYSKLLDLYEDIQMLPKQWNTGLSARTGNLSGGQKKEVGCVKGFVKEYGSNHF